MTKRKNTKTKYVIVVPLKPSHEEQAIILASCKAINTSSFDQILVLGKQITIWLTIILRHLNIMLHSINVLKHYGCQSFVFIYTKFS